MQSGITVSQELHSAFNDLVSSPSQRGIIATISKETLTPLHTLPTSTTDFFADLPSLKSHLTTNQAAYIILRRYQNAPDGFVAVTYVPDSAPVRQKMLFASTRLTLTRDLGTERFRESLFVTELSELTKEGWAKHEASGELKAPLTEEEQTLQGIKEAEAEAQGGTAGRKLETGAHFSLNLNPDARSALEAFNDTEENLLQLRINVQTETIELASTSSASSSSLSSAISESEPRYTFFKYTHNLSGSSESPVVFIYTCPSGSKIKERMIYASTKQGFVSGVGGEFGIDVAKKIEVSHPSELTPEILEEEFRPKQETKQAFSRPKRPGRR
ncbi:hypothetical protein JMJ35_006035 [Cladonia borealis]|uniref:Twinfilin n=1 Tax=Cladonia borealis TaxID=184061 RepID=A0AA39QYA3_9LECA|nr:hypothetical protein JMJ35_006035 [Cladonia borealis]